MATCKKAIDWPMFIFLIVYACFIFFFSFIIHFIDSQYSIIWIVPLTTLLLTMPYLWIRRLWYLYISIAPTFLFFTWVFIFHTVMNRGFYFNNCHYVTTTYIIPLISYSFVIFLTVKIILNKTTSSS